MLFGPLKVSSFQQRIAMQSDDDFMLVSSAAPSQTSSPMQAFSDAPDLEVDELHSADLNPDEESSPLYTDTESKGTATDSEMCHVSDHEQDCSDSKHIELEPSFNVPLVTDNRVVKMYGMPIFDEYVSSHGLHVPSVPFVPSQVYEEEHRPLLKLPSARSIIPDEVVKSPSSISPPPHPPSTAQPPIHMKNRPRILFIMLTLFAALLISLIFTIEYYLPATLDEQPIVNVSIVAYSDGKSVPIKRGKWSVICIRGDQLLNN